MPALISHRIVEDMRGKYAGGRRRDKRSLRMQCMRAPHAGYSYCVADTASQIGRLRYCVSDTASRRSATSARLICDASSATLHLRRSFAVAGELGLERLQRQRGFALAPDER